MLFEKYYEPTTVRECCEILKKYGNDARILAGGTDLGPQMRLKFIKPKAVIGIWNIPGIDEIKVDSTGLTLGACARLRKISLHKELEKDYKIVMESAINVSSMQVRNIATIGGNACNASPSADAIQSLMVLNAVVYIAGTDGQRDVPIEHFFIGPGKTVLEAGEMVTAFKVPAPKPRTGAVYKKYAIRGNTDISIVGVACKLVVDEEGIIKEACISLASVAPTPLRAIAVEELVTGSILTEELIIQAGEMAAAGCTPITDQRSTAEYRSEMIRVWTRHALTHAYKRARR